MKWENLKNGLCPKCDGVLQPSGRMVICTNGDFNMRMNKMGELMKGKTESKSYQNAIKKYTSLKKRSDDNKKRKVQSAIAQSEERKANLRRMVTKGLISQQEYDLKLSLIK